MMPCENDSSTEKFLSVARGHIMFKIKDMVISDDRNDTIRPCIL